MTTQRKDEIEDHDHMYCPSCHHVMCLEPREERSPPVPDDVADLQRDLDWFEQANVTAHLSKRSQEAISNIIRAARKPPLQDVAEAVADIKQGWTVHANSAYRSDLTGVLTQSLETLIRAASTPPMPVDTISINREVELREAIKILKHEIKFADDAYYPMLTVTQALEQALSSLDAVLSEGE